jgi:Domain of unknown function (DUF1877)
MTIGVLFALTTADEERLANCPEDERPDFIGNEIEELYTDEWSCDTDKSWDAIHRAFNDSLLTYDFVNAHQGVILGGVAGYSETDYIISYKTADEVTRISEALSKLTEQDFRTRYFAIAEDEYGMATSEDDFAYSWSNLEGLKTFYHKAASARRCVIFTAPQ